MDIGCFVAKPIMQVQDGQLCIFWHAKDPDVIVSQCVSAPQEVATVVTT